MILPIYRFLIPILIFGKANKCTRVSSLSWIFMVNQAQSLKNSPKSLLTISAALFHLVEKTINLSCIYKTSVKVCYKVVRSNLARENANLSGPLSNNRKQA